MNKRLRKKKGIYTRFKDKETWSLDYTIACFILPRLIRFKKLNNGIPGRFFLDEDNNLRNDDEWHDMAEKKWSQILDDMIWSFNAIVTEDDEPYMFRNGETPEQYKQRYAEWNNRVQHGLQLFAEYFSDLWW